jgi:hypothetical protein
VSLDSTVIDLCLSLYDWAKFQRAKGAVKLHLVLDHDGYLPCFGIVTDGKVHDVKVAHQIGLAPGTIVVDDRGYNDYRLFGKWTEAGVFFVTRMKDNTRFDVIEQRPVPSNRNICSDAIICLTGVAAAEKCPALSASHRSRARGHRRGSGVLDQSPGPGRQRGGGCLPVPLADRTVLQSSEAEPQDQDVRRHVGQRGQDADLDGVDQHAAAALSATVVSLRPELGQSGGVAAHEPVHPPRPDGLAQSAFRHTARSAGTHSDQLGAGLVLDSSRRHDPEDPS